MNVWHLDRLSSFILLPLVDTFPSTSVSQHAPRLNPSSMVACHRIFRAFHKPTHPKGKATHTHWAHSPPKQNAWTGWHDPTCYTSHPSPMFPVLLITHTTTHGDTHAGCGTYDQRKWQTAFCWPYSSGYQRRCNLEVTSRRRKTELLSFSLITWVFEYGTSAKASWLHLWRCHCLELAGIMKHRQRADLWRQLWLLDKGILILILFYLVSIHIGSIEDNHFNLRRWFIRIERV